MESGAGGRRQSGCGNPLAGYVVNAIAGEPGGQSAWVALDTPADPPPPTPPPPANVARVSPDGTITHLQRLPLPGEGDASKGAASRLACPAPHECWLTTTQGWLFRLASPASSLPLNEDPAFAGPITYRPPDEGLPQVAPDAPPLDTSGLVEEPPDYGPETGTPTATPPPATITLPLLSDVHTRVRHRTMLELSFKLAVKARVQLLAKRRRQVVAQTAQRTFGAGQQRLLLNLDPRSWPTKLDLKTHALAPLPTVKATSPAANNTNTVTTESLAFPANDDSIGAQLWPAGSKP